MVCKQAYPPLRSASTYEQHGDAHIDPQSGSACGVSMRLNVVERSAHRDALRNMFSGGLNRTMLTTPCFAIGARFIDPDARLIS